MNDVKFTHIRGVLDRQVPGGIEVVLGKSLQEVQVPSVGKILAWGSVAMLAVLVWEQVKFAWWRRGKGSVLPGPACAVPFIGGIVEMVLDPYAFWDKQIKFSCPGLSWNSILGSFTVMVTDPAAIRNVFNHNSPDSLMMELHPSAKIILGKRNIAFMHGPEHTALRKSFLGLFTRKALGVYVQKQDAVIRRALSDWVQLGGPVEIRQHVRDMNAFTSQEVFVGPYLDDPKVRAKFSQAFMDMTDAFLAFPLPLPGTMVWKGMQGRKFILSVLREAAARSKLHMREGTEPACLLDFWAQGINDEVEAAAQQGVPPPYYCDNREMAATVMDFLFASQDASTASLVWTLTLMAEHPDVLEKVRAEQLAKRPDLHATLTGDVLKELTYTRQVVKEILRFRPPAPMVPQLAQRPFKLSERYTAPRGALIIPSITAACLQGYEQAHKFDPERFGPERREDMRHSGNYMVFGHGPHYCVGKEYAINHLCAFLAVTSASCDWKRVRSQLSDHMKYLPTVYPYDSVFHLSARA